MKKNIFLWVGLFFIFSCSSSPLIVQNTLEVAPYSVALLFQKSNPPKLSAKEEQENLKEQKVLLLYLP